MALPRIRYLQGYGSVFDGPNWGNNLFLLTVCNLIPVVGPIVVSGYCYELIELNSQMPGMPNPKFMFERFTQYLTRGAWPFVIQLLLQIILQPPLMIFFYAIFIPLVLFAKNLGEPRATLVMLFGMGVYTIVMLGFALTLSLVITPLMLRAGLSQDFLKAFNLRWIIDFNRRVGLDLVLVMLFVICTAPLLVLLGYLACFVGVFVAMTVVNLVGANLSWQLYNLYLARGGTPIPLKPPPPQTPAVPPPEQHLAVT